jgi:hypothetical protein
MPEGDALHRAARRLQVLVGEKLEVETPHRQAQVKRLPEQLDGRRLEPGSHARVRGGIAGMSMGFDIEVHAADEAGLELTAQGPIGIDVRYDLAPAKGGSEVTASVSLLGGGGITGRVVKKATEAMLSAGALDGAAGRIARVAEAA